MYDVGTIRRMLLARRGTWSRIARDTGVSYNWIRKVAHGYIRSPGLEYTLRLMSHPAMREPARSNRWSQQERGR